MRPNPPISTPPNNTSATRQIPQHPNHLSNSLSIKKLTPTQLQERRAQGLCYNCDKKYILGHKCATPKFLLLLTEEDHELDETTSTRPHEQESDPEPLHFQLSSQALNGNTSPKILKFMGLIGGLQVSILVDTGSSHSIIQPRDSKVSEFDSLTN